MESHAPEQKEKSEKYILFYSERCGQCQKFMNILQEYPHINARFEKMDVETLARMGKLPPQLTHTPGVIEGNQLLMGPNAFKWLEKKSKDLVGSGPAFTFKQGFNDMGFSFIGETENNYNKAHSDFENPNKNNGSDIDPNSFDENGKSNQQNNTYNPNVQPSNNNYSGQNIPQLQSVKTNIESTAQSGGSLPAQLRPESINSGSNKLTDSDMERYIASRDNGIAISR